MFAGALCRMSCLCVLVVALRASGLAQSNEQAMQPFPQNQQTSAASQGGSATGGTFAPVLDSEKRPITAGGFVKSGPLIFEGISKQSGLTVWRARTVLHNRQSA